MSFLGRLLKLSLVLYVAYIIYLILFTLESIAFLGVFILFISLLLSVLLKAKKISLAPKFIFSFWFLVAYVFPLGFLINNVDSTYLIGDKSVYSDAAVLTESMIVVLVAYVAVLLATSIRLKNSSLLWNKTISRIQEIPVNHFVLFIGFIWFVLSFFIRKTYQLGVAGVQPTIPNAGVLQYLLFNGNIAVLSYLFIFSLKKGKKYLFPVIILAFVLIVSQALLGWRGDVIKVLVLLVALYVIVKKTRLNNLSVSAVNKNKTLYKIPKKYFYLVLVLIPLMIKLGDVSRSDTIGVNYGHNEEESPTIEYLTKFILRGQGLTRLMYIVNEEDSSFSLTNNFFFLELGDVSSIKYIDNKLYKIQSEQSNSIGGGGIGNSYLSMGLLGVFLTYFFIAFVYHKFYNRLLSSNLNPFLVVCYGQMMMLLPNYIMENTGMFIFKEFLVLVLLNYMYGILMRKRVYKRYSYNIY